MKQEQLDRLADQIVCDSLQITGGERVMIDLTGDADDLAEAVMERIAAVGGVAQVRIQSQRLNRALITQADKNLFAQWAKWECERQEACDAYLSIKAEENIYELADVPKEKYDLYRQHYLQPLTISMAGMKKWLLIRYPTYGMAQLAKLSFTELTSRYFQSCTLPYGRLRERAKPLIDLLQRTEKVRIVGPQTDLQFSIAGMSSFLCDGRYNLPDGELFTAPLLDSVEGQISFNIPTSYLGMPFEQVRLRFSKGKVIEAEGNDREGLQRILETDAGSSRVGEFGIGLNPVIDRPMNNLLFDEKMAGSIHLALGHAYEMADNGNRSAVHWDLVLCQSAAYGGGELWFDGQLIRKDGRFVLRELRELDEWHMEDGIWLES
ncbi:aminopeptidase [Brevibacillus humidisoli]|uniref:aminopeptidase n=1 Tax=Brevibacillus humidisoli TaxID=2895522 RepID=UPI001E4F4C37|nr:aminopeptidase [Brevibacillus humidisoli]UFJ42415.1 aminopeptidase [Brevibacillus humidisoli]